MLLIHSVIFNVVIIIGLCWFYGANKNIQAFGAKEITSSIMAVVWFFIPILNLWKPYIVAQQIWKASNPKLNISNGREWKNLPDSKIIKIWWLVGISSIFIGIIASRFLPVLAYGQWPIEYEVSGLRIDYLIDFFYAPTTITYIVASIFFIRMVRQISTWQEIKAGKEI